MINTKAMRRQKDTSYTKIRHAKVWNKYNELKMHYGDIFKDLPRSRINSEIGEDADVGYSPEYTGQIINRLLKQHGC